MRAPFLCFSLAVCFLSLGLRLLICQMGMRACFTWGCEHGGGAWEALGSGETETADAHGVTWGDAGPG